MVDLVPAGFLPLTEVYAQYRAWLANGHDWRDELGLEARLSRLPEERIRTHRIAVDHVTNNELSDLAGLFADGSLTARVRMPGQSEDFILPLAGWRSSFFPERLFLSDTIATSTGQFFEPAAGRTPFVSARELDAAYQSGKAGRSQQWSMSALRELLIGLTMDEVTTSSEAEAFRESWQLRPLASRPDDERFDPTRLPTWTLVMTVTWIVWRDISEVRRAANDYRAECSEWFGVFRRLPVDGGRGWFEAHGEELRALEPLSVSDLQILEALWADPAERRKLMSVKSAREELWRELAEGGLFASAIECTSGSVVTIPQREWDYLELEARIRGDDDSLRFSHARETEAYKRIALPRKDVARKWPPAAAHDDFGTASSPPFDLSDPDWKLWEAAQWVGCGGRLLTSREIADGDLDDRGATKLFLALFQEKLVATGLNQKRVREPIPSVYWEMATTDPYQVDERHHVSFIDEILKDYGGQFTPVGEQQPRWFGIQVKRDALFAVFPDYAPKDISSEVVPGGNASRKSPRKFEATKAALAALFPKGMPTGLGDKDRLAAVNEWLIEHGHSPVSLATLTRASKSR
ncbi:MAG: hypothetical protein ABL866_16330 [Devosia sp.]